MKIVYQLNHKNEYVGQATADKSPLEPGVWLIPAGCVEAKPPTVKEGYKAIWSDKQQRWNIQQIEKPPVSEPVEEEEEPVAQTNLDKRMEAYAQADAMKNEIEFDALSKGEQPDYTPWIEFVKHIKEQFPLEK